jgi:hypothetical protein
LQFCLFVWQFACRKIGSSPHGISLITNFQWGLVLFALMLFVCSTSFNDKTEETQQERMNTLLKVILPKLKQKRNDERGLVVPPVDGNADKVEVGATDGTSIQTTATATEGGTQGRYKPETNPAEPTPESDNRSGEERQNCKEGRTQTNPTDTSTPENGNRSGEGQNYRSQERVSTTTNSPSREEGQNCKEGRTQTNPTDTSTPENGNRSGEEKKNYRTQERGSTTTNSPSTSKGRKVLKPNLADTASLEDMDMDNGKKRGHKELSSTATVTTNAKRSKLSSDSAKS